MIIEHYEAFRTGLGSEELNRENWDLLRTQSEESAYAIEKNKELYEQNCIRSVSYQISAEQILKILEKNKCRHIVSMGVGKGILEWHLKKQMPELYTECTDYAAGAIEKLKTVFPACNAMRTFDIRSGDYSVFEKGVFFILYRVSEELCYEDWCRVFRKMAAQGVSDILFIPDMLATEELRDKLEHRRIKNREQGRKETFCGWIYSVETLEEMFCAGGYHIVEKCLAGELLLYHLKTDGI